MRFSLAELCLGRPIGVLSLTAALVVLGIVALARLPINLMPDIVYPMTRVEVTYGQTPPEVLLQTVTRILERELSQAEGVELIESSTQQGQVRIAISMQRYATPPSSWTRPRANFRKTLTHPLFMTSIRRIYR